MERVQVFSLRLRDCERDAIHAAAEQAGLSDSEWARLVLAAAAGASALPEQLTRVVTVRTKVRDGKW